MLISRGRTINIEGVSDPPPHRESEVVDRAHEANSISNNLTSTSIVVTPTMRLYLPRVEARLRGITALWFCRKKGHLHTIPCNKQEWDKELAYNRHFTQITS